MLPIDNMVEQMTLARRIRAALDTEEGDDQEDKQANVEDQDHGEYE
ncbi:hypothetical protein IMZ48_40960 [Candidatus Bathyarchaeota archaeon]|nr:hypothetical protein [Candidatus Bathyarchaeota archaeon]